MSFLAKEISASVDLADALDTIAEIQDDVFALRLWIDVAKGDVYSILCASGRKSVTIGNLSARIVPVNIVHCVCHETNAEKCENVLAGADTAVKLVRSERLVVKRKVDNVEEMVR